MNSLFPIHTHQVFISFDVLFLKVSSFDSYVQKVTGVTGKNNNIDNRKWKVLHLGDDALLTRFVMFDL